MHFSKIVLAFAPLAFLTSVLADKHASCTCHNGDSYNWRITTKACAKYAAAGYDDSDVSYDTPSGRCTQNSDDDVLMGDQWEEACRDIAQSGFDCADGKGTCYADPDEVRGWC